LNRYKTPTGSTNWLTLSDPDLAQHYESAGLRDFALRYVTVLSYERTSTLLNERCGGVKLSDQRIHKLVCEQAAEIKIAQETLINTYQSTDCIVGCCAVDIYDAQTTEILYLSDGVCVSKQKSVRDGIAKTTTKTGKERTTTDVRLIELKNGRYKTLVSAPNIDSVSLVKAEIYQEYGKKAANLPIVVISDGARSIKNEVKQIFGQQVMHILDWYHLQTKVYQLMTQIAPNKTVKEQANQCIINALWKGLTQEAIAYIQQIKAKNVIKQDELIGYLQKNENYIIKYDERKKINKLIGSGRGEKQNDIIIAKRQKEKGMAWSPIGSLNMALITTLFNNKQIF
jgi:hypothetical protein